MNDKSANEKRSSAERVAKLSPKYSISKRAPLDHKEIERLNEIITNQNAKKHK